MNEPAKSDIKTGTKAALKTTSEPPAPNRKFTATLVYAAFVAGLCSIVYELLIATTVSYFLGDSVRYFSLTIGLYMAAMGAGSYVSKYVTHSVLFWFIAIELALGMIGGLSIPLLYFSYSYAEQALFIPTYVAMTILVGFLIGMEIPFLTRLMESYQSLRFNIANILSFDYTGALIATLAFPFFLLPVLGNYQSSIVLGLINLSIVAVMLKVFGHELNHNQHHSSRPNSQRKSNHQRKLTGLLVLCAVLLGVALLAASYTLRIWDQSLYSGRIVYAEQTPYQKVVVTQQGHDIRLFLNGNIQFSSVDEFRYHESLVDFPIAHTAQPVKQVLLLGAGDGLAIRELLEYPEIEQITLVDLDQRVVAISASNPHISKLNQNSLDNSRVKIVYSDAFSFLSKNQQAFDLIISDLPDPNNISLARLYSKQFYRLLRQQLSPNGIFVTQATSPFFSLKAFRSIEATIGAAGFNTVKPYHALVPSFGDWGFVMARVGSQPFSVERDMRNTRFLNNDMLTAMSTFSRDQTLTNIDVNSLDKPLLLQYYLEGWKTYGY